MKANSCRSETHRLSGLRRARWLMLAIGWLAILACPTRAAEQRTSLTIDSSGRCVVRSETTQPRAMAEQQVKMLEQFQRRANPEDAEDDAPPKPAEPDKAKKPLTDEELSKKLREQSEGQGWLTQYGGEAKVESIDFKSNTVRTVATVTYATPEELLRAPWALAHQSGLAFESLRLEKDTNSNLRFTLTPYSGNVRWAKQARQSWKQGGVSFELRFVFPGKVLGSGLPNTESNATWIAIDPKKEETVERALKLYDAPTVITAELGGLKLDAPLDSKVLQRNPRRGSGGGPELPITDAGPGFAAEALHVTITTVHLFPEGAKYRKQTESALGYQPTGAVVQAKLYAPKGRTLQSVSGLRVLKAVDDKGRPLADGAQAEESFESTVYSYSDGGQGAGNSTQIQLRLPLPASDAQSIEQLDAEAIATTAGNWKELTVPKVTAATTNEIDLSTVLAGAKMVLRKFNKNKHQTTFEGEIKGPASIQQIEVTARAGDSERRSMAHATERGFTTKDNVSTRKFQLQSYSYSEDGEDAEAGPLSVVVRFPEDQKRERVKFTLKGLDLF